MPTTEPRARRTNVMAELSKIRARQLKLEARRDELNHELDAARHEQQQLVEQRKAAIRSAAVAGSPPDFDEIDARLIELDKLIGERAVISPGSAGSNPALLRRGREGDLQVAVGAVEAEIEAVKREYDAFIATERERFIERAAGVTAAERAAEEQWLKVTTQLLYARRAALGAWQLATQGLDRPAEAVPFFGRIRVELPGGTPNDLVRVPHAEQLIKRTAGEDRASLPELLGVIQAHLANHDPKPFGYVGHDSPNGAPGRYLDAGGHERLVGLAELRNESIAGYIRPDEHGFATWKWIGPLPEQQEPERAASQLTPRPEPLDETELGR